MIRFDTIQQLLSSGETKKALTEATSQVSTELEKNYDKTVKELFDELVLLSGRYQIVEKESRLGIVSHENERLEKNKVNHILLEIINSLQTHLDKNREDVRPQIRKPARTTVVDSINSNPTKRVVKRAPVLAQKKAAARQSGNRKPQFSKKSLIVIGLFSLAMLFFLFILVPVFADEIEVFEKNDLYGYKKGNEVVIPAMYSFATDFSKGQAEVILNDTLFAIDEEGNRLSVAGVYTFEKTEFELESFADVGEIIASKKGKFGVVDYGLEQIISFTYDDLNKIYGTDYIVASINGMKGVIDLKGEEVVPFEYESISTFVDNRFSVQRNGKWGVINISNQKKLEFSYDDVKIIPNSTVYAVKIDEFWDFIDNEGRKLTSQKFRDIWIGNRDDRVCIGYSSNGEYREYLYDHQGNIISCGSGRSQRCNFWIRSSFDNGLAMIEDLYSKKCGFINTKGEIVIEPEFESVDFFIDGYSVVTKERNGEWYYGVIDISGSIIIPCNYQRLGGPPVGGPMSYIADHNFIPAKKKWEIRSNQYK